LVFIIWQLEIHKVILYFQHLHPKLSFLPSTIKQIKRSKTPRHSAPRCGMTVLLFGVFVFVYYVSDFV